MRKKHLGLALVCAAMFLAVPVLAEDTVITDSLNFCTMDEDREDTYYSWDASHKILTLHDGFRMDVGSNGTDAIVIPGGTMVFVEGSAAIASADDCISVESTDPDTPPNSVTIILEKDAVLSLNADGDGIETLGNLAIVGEDRDSGTLRIDAEKYGIITSKNIHTKDCTVDIDSLRTCMRAFNQDRDDAFEEFQKIIVENSTLDLKTEAHQDSAASGNVRRDPTMHAGKTVAITDSTVVIDAAGVGISASEISVDIINSSLDITAGIRGIITAKGDIRIDSSRIDMIADKGGFFARDTTSKINTIEITNTSLDVTVVSKNILFNSDVLKFDDNVVLYGANGRRLTNIPIRYTEDLVVVKRYKPSESAWEEEDFNHCYLRNIPVHRLVTAADTSIYVEMALGSMQTISFAGEGTGSVKSLWRAFGSTVNLARYTPADREGYVFTGWYTDRSCTKPVTKIVVIGDMELYAGWKAIPAAEEETTEITAE